MKIFTITKYLLAISVIVFLFIDWRIAIGLFLLSTIFHVIPLGPHVLFKVIAGFFVLGGVIYVFVDWKISITLFVAGYFVTIFYGWVNQKNIEYYGEIRGFPAQTKAKIKNKEQILEFLRNNKKVTNNNVEKLVKVSHATAERYLDELEKEGKVEQHGKIGQNVFYTLSR